MQIQNDIPITTVTPKGQVTIPLPFRKKLQLESGDKVAFELDDNTLKVIPVKYTLKTLYGAVPPLKKKLSFARIRQIALEDKLNAFR